MSLRTKSLYARMYSLVKKINEDWENEKIKSGDFGTKSGVIERRPPKPNKDCFMVIEIYYTNKSSIKIPLTLEEYRVFKQFKYRILGLR